LAPSALAAALVALGLAAAWMRGVWPGHRPAALGGEPRRAIIVDQLSSTHPNPELVAGLQRTLEQGGYSVEVVTGAAVTVRFLQQLPLRQDELLLLRMHAARIATASGSSDDVALFTGERIDLRRYELHNLPAAPATAVAEALAADAAAVSASAGDAAVAPAAARTADTLSLDEQSRLIPVFYDPETRELPLFGIRPTFVERDFKGRFKAGTAVVLLGCDGLRSERMARAFASRGAGVFVSWDRPVSAEHTDAAAERLVELIATERVPVSEAVERTMADIGPDPSYGGRLVVYRSDAP
jgi:hypothetical protein